MPTHPCMGEPLERSNQSRNTKDILTVCARLSHRAGPNACSESPAGLPRCLHQQPQHHRTPGRHRAALKPLLDEHQDLQERRPLDAVRVGQRAGGPMERELEGQAGLCSPGEQRQTASPPCTLFACSAPPAQSTTSAAFRSALVHKQFSAAAAVYSITMPHVSYFWVSAVPTLTLAAS